MGSWGFLVLSIAANVGANIAFKHFVQTFRLEGSWLSVGRAFLYPSFLIGLCFGFTLLFSYLRALRDLPMATAYTVATSLSIAGITAASVFIYGEALSLRALAGIVVVLIGVTLLASG